MVATNDLEVRKAMGRAHLQADDLNNAVGIFAGILRDYPQDVDSYIALGDCYLAGDDGETAAELYLEAWRLNPLNKEIEKRITLAQMESEFPKPNGEEQKDSKLSVHPAKADEADVNPTDPQSITNLLKNLTGSVEQTEDTDIQRAEKILYLIEHSTTPGAVVTEQLDEIIKLLPALIQLNIRQAKADGYPELADALQELLLEIQQDKNTEGSVQESQPRINHQVKIQESLPSVLFIGPESDASPQRQKLPAQALSALGCTTEVRTAFPKKGISGYDAVIVNRPHINPELLEGMALCKAENIPIILDIDIDCERMPLEHPLYDLAGFGQRTNAQTYYAALILADKICVPSKTLARIMSNDGYQAEVIPPGWIKENVLWHRPTPERHTINIAWLGHPGQLEDIAHIRRMVIRIMREFPQAVLVIGSEPRAYQLFNRIPENRILYLPPASFDDYPYYLGQADIIVAPLRNTPFNQSQTDEILIDAGVRGIPWIGSPIPSFTEWQEGGLVANTINEWHTHLRQLIMDEELRHYLGKAGKSKVMEREMDKLSNLWLKLVEDVIREKEVS